MLELLTSTTFTFYTVDVDLDGVTFRLQFKFNDRDSAWYMSIFSTADVELRTGIKVVSDWTLLRLWQEIQLRPAGEMIATTQGDIARPALVDELGAEVVLTYLDEDEIEAANV